MQNSLRQDLILLLNRVRDNYNGAVLVIDKDKEDDVIYKEITKEEFISLYLTSIDRYMDRTDASYLSNSIKYYNKRLDQNQELRIAIRTYNFLNRLNGILTPGEIKNQLMVEAIKAKRQKAIEDKESNPVFRGIRDTKRADSLLRKF